MVTVGVKGLRSYLAIVVLTAGNMCRFEIFLTPTVQDRLRSLTVIKSSFQNPPSERRWLGEVGCMTGDADLSQPTHSGVLVVFLKIIDVKASKAVGAMW